MTLSDAIELIQPAARDPSGTWADFGAGEGLFTRALARLLGERGRMIAVDRDERALAILGQRAGAEAERIETARGDFRDLDRIAELNGIRLSGALFANALHFVPDPAMVLDRVSSLLLPGARVIVVEYDRRAANTWVPYPLPTSLLPTMAERAGYGVPEVVARRPSAFHRQMYCAVLSGTPSASGR